MFENLGWWEIGALLILALLIFGDKLPKVINDSMNMLRNLRRMASNAAGDLGKELGTDIQLSDLHPKTFIRKHLLTEEDEAIIRRPLEGLQRDLKEVTEQVDFRRGPAVTQTADLTTAEPTPPQPTPTQPTPVARRSFDDVT